MTQSPAQERKSERLARRRILIVEDDDDAREILRLLLEACGAHVIETTSVSEALWAFGKAQVDLLISDIGLPGRDGYALIETVRATPTLASVPAIALTAFTAEQTRARALKCGFDAHLNKPIDAQALLSIATALVERR